jgi:hypothetical protein
VIVPIGCGELGFRSDGEFDLVSDAASDGPAAALGPRCGEGVNDKPSPRANASATASHLASFNSEIAIVPA